MHINLTDNNYQDAIFLQSLVPLQKQNNSLEQVQDVIKSLKEISSKKISELKKDNSSILVYPENFETHKDDVGALSILNLIENKNEKSSSDEIAENENTSTIQNEKSENHTNEEKLKLILEKYPELEPYKNYSIKTSNLMGFIGVGNTTIRIKSRFDSQSQNDNFLHYMLAKVFKINLVNFNNPFTKNDDALDLLYFVFPRLLKRALKKGVFRKYQTFARNDAAVKGPIDIARHIKKNIPFNGRIAYNSREFSYDNEVTELIRHTIEVIKHSDFGKAILSNDDEMRLCVNQILQATPNYSKRERLNIIQKNKKPLKHSFYAEYSDLQKLCLAILRRKTLSFNKTDKNEIYGIIFDGAWLWEEYLWTVLCDCGFKHPENKASKGGISIFTNRTFTCYPDFYKDDFVLDAKYKRLNYVDKNSTNLAEENSKYKISLQRDDIYQLISYMHILKVDNGAFIYPISTTEVATSVSEKIQKLNEDIKIKGVGGFMNVYGVPIPQSSSQEEMTYSDFADKMNIIEEELKSLLKNKKSQPINDWLKSYL